MNLLSLNKFFLFICTEFVQKIILVLLSSLSFWGVFLV